LDFRPSMVLSDVWAIVDFGTEVNSEGKTRSVNHVQQMRDSTCYLKSQKQMGCTSCHDPHSSPQPETKIEFYRNRCNNCHSGEAEVNPICSETILKRENVQDDCTACHMPRLASTNMSHVAQTDHRILRQPGRIAEDATVPTTLSFFDNHGERFLESERQRNLVLGTIVHCQRRGIAIPESVYSYLLEISKSRSNDAPLFAALGALAQSRNEIAKAKEFYKTALTADPDFDAALDGIFDIAFIQEDWHLCLVYSDKLLESEPRYGRIIAMRGEAFARLGQIDMAIAEWEKAVEIDPGFEVLRQMLVDACSQQGNKYQAEVHAALLKKLQSATIPDSVTGVR
jgi:predicted CXXCH cytochrome family protein